MKRILWVSQHRPLPIQIETLRQMYGEIDFERLPREIKNAEEIEQEFHNRRCDVLVVVAPYSVIARLLDLNLPRPLYAKMRQVDPRSPEADLVYRGRGYRFECFEEVEAVRIEFKSLGPRAQRPRR